MNTVENEQGVDKIYPTTADADGFYYESSDDEDMGILTRVYETGTKTKKSTLPDSGKVAVVRSLLAKDSKEISRFMGKDSERYEMSIITVATTFDSQKWTFEDVESMRLKDYNLLRAMNMALNF